MNNTIFFWWDLENGQRFEDPITLDDKQLCSHDWVKYVGLTQRDVFCNKCKEKVDWDEALKRKLIND